LINANFQGLDLSINWKHATSSNQIHQKENQTYPTDKDRDTTIIMDQKKSNKIREIVRLQQILKKWRRIANSSKTTTISTTTNNITSSKSMKFLKRTLSLSEREGTTITSSNNGSVPKGYLAVCVGEELKRFIIPTEYLSHQAFQILLREAEEEFGFQQTGVLRIPCEVTVFESTLKIVEDGKKNDKFSNQECRPLSIEEMMGFCSLENQLACSHHPQSPLCR
jgi:SAUR family protein